jgi:hypothetical protein
LPSPNILEPFKVFAKYFDYKVGIAGGLVMGIIVFLINYFATSDGLNSGIAAAKQSIYTFFFGGAIMKLAEILSINIRQAGWAIFLAMMIPSIISILLTFGVHSLKGTPMPIESTIPTAIFVIPSTFIWAIIKRRKIKSAQQKTRL